MESVKNSITGIFKSKKDEDINSDHLIITVSQVDPKTKERKTVCEGIFICFDFKI
jgi:hypothetical protein